MVQKELARSQKHADQFIGLIEYGRRYSLSRNTENSQVKQQIAAKLREMLTEECVSMEIIEERTGIPRRRLNPAFSYGTFNRSNTRDFRLVLESLGMDRKDVHDVAIAFYQLKSESGSALKFEREDREITVRAITEATSIDSYTIYQIERNMPVVKASHILAIAGALGLDDQAIERLLANAKDDLVTSASDGQLKSTAQKLQRRIERSLTDLHATLAELRRRQEEPVES